MRLAETLVEYKEIFAWFSSDLDIVLREIAEHKLGIPANAKSVFQKKQVLARAKQEVIRKDVKELFDVEIIKPTDLQEWLSNPVVVPKTERCLASVY